MRDVFNTIAKNMLFSMPKPNEATFKSTEREFRERWNFPNVVGCLDGKHIRIRCPHKSGSLYYNYKNYFSIILFALSDANCKFMAIDVGSFGRKGDAGNFFSNTFVFDSSIEMNYHLNRYLPKIAYCIRNKLFDLPGPKLLPNSNIQAPHVFLGDEAFPLLDNLLKPYRRVEAAADRTKSIFNYRLSRARRLVENSFGILANRFRIFHTTIGLSPSTVQNLVTSACIIHNLIIDEQPIIMHDDELLNQGGFDSVDRVIDNDRPENNLDAIGIRNMYKVYLNGAGAVDWQYDML